MFDLFGTGAKARVKALEEALSLERERNQKLTETVIALSDLRAHRVVTMTPEERAERLHPRKAPVQRPGSIQALDSIVRKARETFKADGTKAES